MNEALTVTGAANMIRSKLLHHFGVKPKDATNENFYQAVAYMLRDYLFEKREEVANRPLEKGEKRIYYLCMEFLMGRSLKNNLYNLGIENVISDALSELDIKIDKLYACEPDAGLGNGGLGRLAACFLDGLSTSGYYAVGYSLRYEFGIFRQRIEDGWQTELPDNWLPGGSVWLVPRPERTKKVTFGGHIENSWDGKYHAALHVGATEVEAIPYDMLVPGKDSEMVSSLRLWSARAPGIDMNLFNRGDYMRAVEKDAMAEVITKVLYPSDNHREGKSLRLRQQYFLVSATIQDIIHRHLADYGTLENLPDKVAIHINDTHPALAIPELMRILMDECGFDWAKSWDIVTRTVAYTNHTVLSEALEVWPEDLFSSLLPRIHQIVEEINRRECEKLIETPGSTMEKVSRMAIAGYGAIRMANLAVLGSHSVNGVSRLHSDILKDDVFHDYYTVYPERFKNVTNGVAHRRWLCQANKPLTALITELIGDGFVKDASQLIKLREYEKDSSVLAALENVKLQNKTVMAKYIKKVTGTVVDPNSIFDVQLKRLHEYKRQHLNALHIISTYLALKENPNADILPRTYIFGAKAAPSYHMAKLIIRLIYKIGEEIEKDEIIRQKLKVIYMEDYRVTLAEMLMPAAEISEQISLASTEASGTGNMKMMLNGAVTLGTLDGANVEISERVGSDNILLFGLKADEVGDLRKSGYNPGAYYNADTELRKVVDALRPGFCGVSFNEIFDSLTGHDPYMVFADYRDYCRAQGEADALYRDRARWNSMSLRNIAEVGIFSADRAIGEYAKNIWETKPCAEN